MKYFDIALSEKLKESGYKISKPDILALGVAVWNAEGVILPETSQRFTIKEKTHVLIKEVKKESLRDKCIEIIKLANEIEGFDVKECAYVIDAIEDDGALIEIITEGGLTWPTQEQNQVSG